MDYFIKWCVRRHSGDAEEGEAKFKEMKPAITITLTQFTISAKFTLHKHGAPEYLLYSNRSTA